MVLSVSLQRMNFLGGKCSMFQWLAGCWLCVNNLFRCDSSRLESIHLTRFGLGRRQMAGDKYAHIKFQQRSAELLIKINGAGLKRTKSVSHDECLTKIIWNGLNASKIHPSIFVVWTEWWFRNSGEFLFQYAFKIATKKKRFIFWIANTNDDKTKNDIESAALSQKLTLRRETIALQQGEWFVHIKRLFILNWCRLKGWTIQISILPRSGSCRPTIKWVKTVQTTETQSQWIIQCIWSEVLFSTSRAMRTTLWHFIRIIFRFLFATFIRSSVYI